MATPRPTAFETSPANPDFAVSPLPDQRPFTDLAETPDRPEEFTFALLSDRTGFAREGVFERAVEMTNLFNPDFVVQVGDAIEGYTENLNEIWGQWREYEAITSGLNAPLFRTPGNHDVSNEVMRTEWLRRYGALHYAWRYRDVLFVVLDTQDPPPSVEEMTHGMSAEEFSALLRKMHHNVQEDPAEFIASQKDHIEGPMGARFSESQLAWIREVLAAHHDVRHTFVFMHIPCWQDKESREFTDLRAALSDREYTVFGGHCHNYKREVIDGRDWIRLGSTGGVWVTDKEDGNWDHITLVSLTRNGVKIANIVLEGIFGAEGGAFDYVKPLAEPMRLATPAEPAPAP
ncbi:metallophosphoesterase family protein [Streptomyces carpinensis]|uniref:Metallophosphoesterase n=1 Tax=Streptomyces carpinensis TaxID=66369 RepID=A0ABV1VYC5_9ACTN|nr:metallophosphoesterase [Streptomyces carpinensis]